MTNHNLEEAKSYINRSFINGESSIGMLLNALKYAQTRDEVEEIHKLYLQAASKFFNNVADIHITSHLYDC